ncbi:MAG: hypothetical protein RLZZ263_36, partial [Cyanobacteriota bacterium]
TQAARTTEVVKVPAQTAPSGASSKERSGFPEAFRPAVMAEARNPCGAVMPPSMTDQGWDTAAQMTPPILHR